MTETTVDAQNRKPDWIGIVSVSALLLLVVLLASQRQYFTWGVETDYLGGFKFDAERLLNGLPPLLGFHPPLFPIVVAAVQWATSDWFLTGRVVSVVSTLVFLISSLSLFRRIFSLHAGWGAVAACAVSPLFLEYSISASSDMFFMALFMSTIAVAARACNDRSNALWIAAGLLMGCALLTRTNGITLLLLFALPFLQGFSASSARRDLLLFVGGAALPIGLWAFCAALIGAPFGGGKTYLNLALTYFSPDADRISGDSRVVVEKQFASLWEVLRHDPIRIAKTYLKDIFNLPGFLFSRGGLLAYPLNLLGFALILWLALTSRTRWFWYLCVLLIAQIGLLNFKAPDARFYLLLVPLIGAAAAEFIGSISKAEPYGKRSALRFAGGIALLLLILGSGAKAITDTVAHFRRAEAELAESVPQVIQFVTARDVLVSRKPHLSHYSGARSGYFPRTGDLDVLRRHLDSISGGVNVYLYYGAPEKTFRPGLRFLSEDGLNPPWLELVARSSRGLGWALYRYAPSK